MGHLSRTVPDSLLTDRTARCSYYKDCEHAAPSDRGLAFFEYRGPGSIEAVTMCKHCRYHRKAHEIKINDNPPHLRQVCDNFENNPEGSPYDRYYCGCRGWN